MCGWKSAKNKANALKDKESRSWSKRKKCQKAKEKEICGKTVENSKSGFQKQRIDAKKKKQETGRNAEEKNVAWRKKK
jgi:hypothetical protein